MNKKTETTKKVVNHVRMVTEADIKADPRLLDAGVAVGNLYDFSNLDVLPKGASFAEEEVDRRNEIKATAIPTAAEKLKEFEKTDATDTAQGKVTLQALKVEAAKEGAVDEVK